jgi:hypothetical protein
VYGGRYYRVLYQIDGSPDDVDLTLEFVPGNKAVYTFRNQTADAVSPWGPRQPTVLYRLADGGITGRSIVATEHAMTGYSGSEITGLAGRSLRDADVACPEADRAGQACEADVLFENGAYGLMSVTTKEPSGPPSDVYNGRYYRFVYQLASDTSGTSMVLEFTPGNKKTPLFRDQTDDAISPFEDFPAIAFELVDGALRGRAVVVSDFELR